MDKKRVYSSFFHLHTICGIIISAVLFVLFYCGAVTMFKDEIVMWEKGYTTSIERSDIDFDRIMSQLDSAYNLTGRNVLYYLDSKTNILRVYVDHSHVENASQEDLETHVLYVDLNDYSTHTYEDNYTYSEFMYRLHFLSQIPTIGIYISGIVSVMFLLALITGIYIHWDKIIKNFFLFRPKSKWKAIWTDAHTVLGTIGLPFQFIYALTGSLFCLLFLVLLPAYTLYDNDYEKLMQDLRPLESHAPWQSVVSERVSSINEFVNINVKKWPEAEVYELAVENINGSNMEYQLNFKLPYEVGFTGEGSISTDAYTLEVINELNPYESTYVNDVLALLYQLHFGRFGGYFIKFIYVALALLTCFVIISGVMVWLTARKKKTVPLARQKFNFKVANIYLAICLSLIPMSALGFILAKVLPVDYSGSRKQYFYITFFGSWLILSIYFMLKKNLAYTNKASLFLGGILFITVPIVNGVISNHWLWNSLLIGAKDIFMVDVFCLFMGMMALYAYYLIKKKAA
ncbi:MAG: PepSY-associated TM helix domain-containing protein [Weeksellaceae bacterium]